MNAQNNSWISILRSPTHTLARKWKPTRKNSLRQLFESSFDTLVMASTSQQNEGEPGSSSVVNPVDEVRAMTWGSELKEDVFLRWSQGKIFLKTFSVLSLNWFQNQSQRITSTCF